jgi:hypothetical protein
MRPACRIRAITAALVAAGIAAAPARGQELGFPRDHHPWGHFPVNSWKTVRTTVESLDDKGKVASITVTDTTTKLVAVDDSGFSLKADSTVTVAGQRIASTSPTTKYGFYGESAGQTPVVKRAADASLTIDGRAIPCEVRQVSLAGDSGKLISTLYYSSEFPPFVLRRETSLEGAPEEKHNATLVEVVALDLPQRVRGELKQASYIKTTQKLPKTTKVTLEVHCDDVPGGVVAHWASEADPAGRVVRRSMLELINYEVASPAGQPQSMIIRRPLRGPKAVRRMDQR